MRAHALRSNWPMGVMTRHCLHVLIFSISCVSYLIASQMAFKLRAASHSKIGICLCCVQAATRARSSRFQHDTCSSASEEMRWVEVACLCLAGATAATRGKGTVEEVNLKPWDSLPCLLLVTNIRLCGQCQGGNPNTLHPCSSFGSRETQPAECSQSRVTSRPWPRQVLQVCRIAVPLVPTITCPVNMPICLASCSEHPLFPRSASLFSFRVRAT